MGAFFLVLLKIDSKNKGMAGKFVFRRNLDIGSLEAETDSYLIETFTDKGDFDVLKDTQNGRCILIGRTGSGKSALLKYLEDQEENVSRINPEAMSLKYLSNSDIIKYLKALGTNLDLFYKVLWKHVFIVELLKMYFGEDAYKSGGILNILNEKYFLNKKKKEALDYLRQYKDDFWEKTEIRVRTVEDQIKTKLSTEIGITPSILDKLISGKFNDELEHLRLEKQDIANKAQKVISELQADAIYSVVEILKDDIFKIKHKKYYIIIDDLDKDWVDISIVYDLIRALIVTINELKAIPSTKIIIALRDNLYEKTFQFGDVRGMQREKFRQLNLILDWNSIYLKELLNKRLARLMKSQYTNTLPTIEDVMPKATGNKLSGFDYLIRRTLLRPRDVIAFFNKCIDKSNGQSTITRETLGLAEPEYSRERLEAVEDEWLENFGSILPLTLFLKGTIGYFKLKDLKENDIEQTLFASVGDKKSSLHKIQNDYIAGTVDFSNTVKSILSILYRVGILGVKLSASDSTMYAHSSTLTLEPADITDESKFYVHLMFYAALKINPKASTLD